MEELEDSVRRAAGGDLRAFERLVLHFQDMAMGYAYSLLGDVHLAEDAAQEAFVEAWRDLARLRQWRAFPAWLRRIVYKRCDRLTRKRRPSQSLGTAPEPVAPQPDPLAALERSETAALVRRAVEGLSPPQREATTLFYISAYSQKEVAAFLDVPVTTVQKRLHDARKQLQKRMMIMAKDDIRAQRPSQDGRFAALVMDLIAAINRGDARQVGELVAGDGQLLAATAEMEHFWDGAFPPLILAVGRVQREVVVQLLDAGADIDAAGGHGWTALRLALDNPQRPLVDLLIERGADIDIFSAARLGDAGRVRELLAQDAGLANAEGPGGETPLRWAATAEVAALLLDAGADMTGVLGNGVGYVHSPIERGFDETVQLLIERGAEVDASAAVRLNDAERVRALVAEDPSLVHKISANRSLLHLAKTVEIAGILLDAGADINLRDPGHAQMPVEWATNHDCEPELVHYLIERGAQKTLHLACKVGDLDMAKEVLDADPDQANFVPREPHLLAGYPAQHIALWGGHADIIRLLAERGADLGTRSATRDLTVLGWARRGGNEEMIRVLEELGAPE